MELEQLLFANILWGTSTGYGLGSPNCRKLVGNGYAGYRSASEGGGQGREAAQTPTQSLVQCVATNL